MKKIALSRNLLNSNKILFHYGKMLEDIAAGREDFNPVAVEIHPTAVCNHTCIHCSYKERNENRAVLTREVMDSLTDSIIKMGVKAVYFSGGGEPTLYPNLAEYIIKLADNSVECSIITNGSYFKKAGLIPIANRLNYIAISVPAVDDKTFFEITGTHNLDNVLALPREIKAVHGDKSPVIGSRIVITNKNYRQIADFLNIIKQSEFDYALFKIVRDYEDNGQGLTEAEEAHLKNEIEGLADLDPNFTNIKSVFGYRKLPEFENKCWVNQYGLIANVSMDGKVYPNIVEIDDPNFCIGDLYKQSLEQMWNSPRHNEVKETSNLKWAEGKCKNCRAIAYNGIINGIIEKIPTEYDAFI